MSRRIRPIVLFWCFSICANAQNAPNVSQVLMWSTVTNTGVGRQFSQDPINFVPTATGTLPRALFSVYTNTTDRVVNEGVNVPSHYRRGNISDMNSAISSSVAVALSLVPVASPASAIIEKTDPATGAPLYSAGSLGPIFTERGETIRKGQFYIGFSHQSFHFTRFNGQSLNGITLLDTAANRISSTIAPNPQTGAPAPATVNMGIDIRMSQNIAFLTTGLTNRLELSLGFPMVHSAVAATAYNGQIYGGDGLGGGGPQPGSNCWCVNTFAPGTFRFIEPLIGQSSMSKSGFGDLLVRIKGKAVARRHVQLTLGTDVRFPTGDEENYLGTGATSVKPFVAVSLYTSPTARGIVLSPHFNVGWQFSGKSILGGELTGTQQTATLSNGDRIPYIGAPLVATKGYIPDVFSWAVGTEWALGKRNTIVTDVIGNQIGWIHGAQLLDVQSSRGFSPVGNFAATEATGLAAAGRGSIGQYSGSFGYKALVFGKLVASFNLLVRFDDNGLTSRFAPLYGLSYTF